MSRRDLRRPGAGVQRRHRRLPAVRRHALQRRRHRHRVLGDGGLADRRAVQRLDDDCDTARSTRRSRRSGSSCTVGVGMCARTGNFVCNTARLAPRARSRRARRRRARRATASTTTATARSTKASRTRRPASTIRPSRAAAARSTARRSTTCRTRPVRASSRAARSAAWCARQTRSTSTVRPRTAASSCSTRRRSTSRPTTRPPSTMPGAGSVRSAPARATIRARRSRRASRARPRSTVRACSSRTASTPRRSRSSNGPQPARRPSSRQLAARRRLDRHDITGVGTFASTNHDYTVRAVSITTHDAVRRLCRVRLGQRQAGRQLVRDLCRGARTRACRSSTTSCSRAAAVPVRTARRVRAACSASTEAGGARTPPVTTHSLRRAIRATRRTTANT